MLRLVYIPLMSTPPAASQHTPLKPILTAHLFPKLDGLLLDLLRSLSPGDWEKQTVSPKWKVKDVAAHLLDTPLRGLSIGRDGYVPPAPPLESSAALAAYIDGLNAEGVAVYRHLSPGVLISLMETACKQLADYHASRDPYALAPYGVSWAGEEKSANWFDTAREFTERWHHQHQIRLAVSRPGIMTRELYYPVLDCFMRALPFTYRNVSATPGTAVRITVAGQCGGSWHLHRAEPNWLLTANDRTPPAAETIIPQEIAWRIFTKGISHESALSQVKLSGDPALALPVLGMLSIVSA
ncbi:MAG TPA: maleylpyruvate isomerase N-terminal domain-containing protein [Candidatus Angelobacter sp.]|nr:maleylpyruvate isomerase N-terminal domain-containing protein [Candidatus Angelobacter sp.]